MAEILNGITTSKAIKSEVLARAQALRAKGTEPRLEVILVGDDPASAIYVKHKEKDCAECGIKGSTRRLPADTGQEKLLALIAELNADPSVHGILIQQPFPQGIDTFAVTGAVDPRKDVDALHPENVGLIALDRPRFLPCTPAGVMALLDTYGINPKGLHCVVVGRSHIVGKPMAQLLLARHATVSICHSRTPDLGAITRQADILVSAVGRLGLITGDMIKPGAVVIDVAMNKKPDGKLAGDVVFGEAEPLAAYITPVPGGVGPMTRAILMQNTILAAERCVER
ncbi:MAG: bifunctional 5,10-methylenetetrahydrofolate dehydrogenase/5,10-methenyltetrahydrofolate cyclohydrolase [Oscillospiraceae bacterium]|jgi:methylenetetrahydrofolate dehydrogenase (NADP+)/methenyltetrahydrofolate cyclohydrolase|nr:bifunctional 5,10-methylenetetrahydrofolate dehydrogenase/5,10-methenyltetrahydrofolate cyclohydrolase [Oscillospiraceae bacterium]